MSNRAEFDVQADSEMAKYVASKSTRDTNLVNVMDDWQIITHVCAILNIIPHWLYGTNQGNVYDRIRSSGKVTTTEINNIIFDAINELRDK